MAINTRAFTGTIAGDIVSGVGNLTKQGTGTLILTGTNNGFDFEGDGVTVTVDDAATPDGITVNIPADPNAPDGRIFARLMATQP